MQFINPSRSRNNFINNPPRGGLPPIMGLPELVYGLTSMIDTGLNQAVSFPVASEYERVVMPSVTMYRIKDIADNNNLSFTNNSANTLSLTGRVYLYGTSATRAINVSVGTDNSGVDLPIIENSGTWRAYNAYVGGVACFICDYQVELLPTKSVFPIAKSNTPSDFMVRSGKHKVWGKVNV